MNWNHIARHDVRLGGDRRPVLGDGFLKLGLIDRCFLCPRQSDRQRPGLVVAAGVSARAAESVSSPGAADRLDLCRRRRGLFNCAQHER
jgi:hypothetical protein